MSKVWKGCKKVVQKLRKKAVGNGKRQSMIALWKAYKSLAETGVKFRNSSRLGPCLKFARMHKNYLWVWAIKK